MTSPAGSNSIVGGQYNDSNENYDTSSVSPFPSNSEDEESVAAVVDDGIGVSSSSSSSSSSLSLKKKKSINLSKYINLAAQYIESIPSKNKENPVRDKSSKTPKTNSSETSWSDKGFKNTGKNNASADFSQSFTTIATTTCTTNDDEDDREMSSMVLDQSDTYQYLQGMEESRRLPLPLQMQMQWNSLVAITEVETSNDSVYTNFSNYPSVMSTATSAATAGSGEKKYSKPSAFIPSWSTEDRFKRAVVIPRPWKAIIGSSITIGLLFAVLFLLPELYFEPDETRLISSTFVISIFILMQIGVTTTMAVPEEDLRNEEINDSVNTSILISMVSYPCFGLWIATRSEQLTWSNFWYVLGLDHLYKIKHTECDLYQWGYIFPFLFWSASAVLLIRDSNYAFTLDRKGVITDPKGTGKPMTALFRRKPFFLEVWSHRIMRSLTFSLWTIVPLQYRPVSKAGQFAFQIIAPFVLIFFFIGGRFMLFAMDMIIYMIQNPHDYTMVYKHLDEGRVSEEFFGEILRARFIIWLMFSFYCIIIRGFIGTKSFLRMVVPDPQSFKNRWVGWSAAIVESKRRCVLWAFRGLANAAVPFYVYCKYKDTQSSDIAMSNIGDNTQPEVSTTILDWAAYYLYLATFISFFFEGFGAFWFGLTEAEQGCNLRSPFKLITELSYLAAFNVYLQPLGTLTNIWFFITNREYLMKLRLREICGPFWSNRGDNFWVKLNFNKGTLSKIFNQKPPKQPTLGELEVRLDEWIETWKRKRINAGRDIDNISIRSLESSAPFPVFTGSRIFRGTMFPTYDEWLYMRSHCEEYLSLLPWERVHAPEKFLRWYPSYREQIMSLLQEPRDFEVRREVWMFEYGSLISPENPPAGLTRDQKKQIIPYWLKEQAGYRRIWNYRQGLLGLNALGLEWVGVKNNSNRNQGNESSRNNSGDRCAMNIAGCVYPMDYEKASDLFGYKDEGYELLFVHEDYFEAMHPDFRLPKGIGYVWVCGQPTLKCGNSSSNKCAIMECKRHNPTIDSPILQSYIDTLLQGALRYSTAGRGHVDGMNFAAAILKSTAGWNCPWYNDRLLAGRPWTFLPQYKLIDGLLSTCPTSRNAFVKRLNTAMQCYVEKQPMLEYEKEDTLQWSDMFFANK